MGDLKKCVVDSGADKLFVAKGLINYSGGMLFHDMSVKYTVLKSTKGCAGSLCIRG